MFRRKEEENVTETDASQSKESKEVKTESKSEPTGTSTAGTSSVAATPSPAASPVPAVARPAEPKVAPMNQPTSSYRPAPTPAARPGLSPSMPSSAADNASGKKRILTVGNDILLKGEIATCDRLVIEGAVDAKLNDVHTVEIAETGSFKGSAQIEDAEISGLFEGDLVVRNRLIIYSTGKVRGKITYGEIEIERGGELTGEIKTGAAAASESKEDKDKTKAA